MNNVHNILGIRLSEMFLSFYKEIIVIIIINGSYLIQEIVHPLSPYETKETFRTTQYFCLLFLYISSFIF